MMPDGNRYVHGPIKGIIYDHTSGQYIDLSKAVIDSHSRPGQAILEQAARDGGKIWTPPRVKPVEKVETSVANLKWVHDPIAGEFTADVSKLDRNRQIRIMELLQSDGVDSVEKGFDQTSMKTVIRVNEVQRPKLLTAIEKISGKRDLDVMSAAVQLSELPQAAGLYSRAVEQKYGESEGGYKFKPTKTGHIQFDHSSVRDDDITGWKTHLSVARADVARATEIVMDVYREHGGMSFKVTSPDATARISDPAISGAQAGKIFTLYDAGEKTWPQMIRDIERRFEQAQIRPGPPVIEDATISGAKYSFRRNDLDPKGNYVSAVEARHINPSDPANPFGKPDPLKGFSLAADSQPVQAKKPVAPRSGSGF